MNGRLDGNNTGACALPDAGALYLSRGQTVALLLIPLACAASMLFLPALAVLPLLIVLAKRRVATHDSVACVGFAAIYTALIATGAVSFPLFPQASKLYASNPNLAYWLRSGHLHAPRLLIASPGLLLAQIVGCTETEGMTIYTGALMLLILCFMLELLRRLQVRSVFCRAVCCVCVAGLSLVMNGRLVFAFFGEMLLLFYEIRFERGECGPFALFLANVAAVAFSLVSSGTMMIMMAYTALMFAHRRDRLTSKRQRQAFAAIHVVFLLPILFWLVPFVLRFLKKNLDYFGGGLQGAYHMLMHGMGKILVVNSLFAVVPLILAGIAVFVCNVRLFVRYVVRRDDPRMPLLLILNISLYGSLFGRSTGLMGLLPLVLLLLITWNKSVTTTGGFRE